MQGGVRVCVFDVSEACVGTGDDEDLVEEACNNELTSLLSQESGGQVSGGREPFEDQYGDTHDWTSGVTTQLYLCRQLYLHYTLNVSPPPHKDPPQRPPPEHTHTHTG